jgi:hypothetical protein
MPSVTGIYFCAKTGKPIVQASVSYLSLNTADSFTSYRILDVNVCLRQNRFDPHFLPGRRDEEKSQDRRIDLL